MVVKETRGRRRYIAFSLSGSIPGHELERRISSSGCGQVRVIQCAGGWCILRSEPGLIDRTIETMGEVCPGCASVSTSGNLLTLRRRYPILWETRPRYIAFTVSVDGRTLSDGIDKVRDDDGPSLKFSGSGYAIVKCTLRDADRTKAVMKDIDPTSEAFVSSYDSKDVRKAVADRCPQLRPLLLARR